MTALQVGLADRAALVAAVLGPLALYVATLPRTVVLEDDGLFLMAGVHLGVAHPPGYPLYTLIVHLFTRLPFADAAFLGHLSSAVLGALACGALYISARLLRASPVPALTAAWLFGVAEPFWSQAVIAEVYTLNALLFFTTYALVLHGARQPRRGWPLACAAVAWGTGLANHWPLMVLATPGLALALLTAWRDVRPRLPKLLGLSLASAALPYVWMVWLSHQAPLISFYGSIDSWNDFWFFVTRQGYSAADVSPSAGWSDRWSYLAWFARDLVRQSTLPGFALALLGLGTLLRAGGRTAVGAGGSAVALLGNSLVLILLLGFDFDEFQVAVFRPYPLICYGVSALWVAAGMQWLLGRLQAAAAARRPEGAPSASRAPRAARGPAGLVATAGAAMVLASASAGWPANDRSDSDFTERYAEAVLDTLPPNAVLLVNDDISIPLGYYHHVEGRRPDVTLYHLQALAYANRLYDPFLPSEEKVTVLDRFVGSTESPVFALRDWDFYPGQRAFRHFGFLVEMLAEDSPNTIELPRNPRGEQYFVDLLDTRPADRWERLVRYQLLFRYGYYLGLIALSGSPLLLEPMEAVFRRAKESYACLIGMASALLDGGLADNADRVSAWLSQAEALHHQALRKADRARLPFEQGRLAESAGDLETAAARYRQSHAIHRHPGNQARNALRRLGLTP